MPVRDCIPARLQLHVCLRPSSCRLRRLGGDAREYGIVDFLFLRIYICFFMMLFVSAFEIFYLYNIFDWFY
jgi:hypothetical protein